MTKTYTEEELARAVAEALEEGKRFGWDQCALMNQEMTRMAQAEQQRDTSSPLLVARIKRYRDVFGCALKEAKEACEYGRDLNADRTEFLQPSQPAGAKPVAWANWKVDSESYVPYRTQKDAQDSVNRSSIAAMQEGPYKVVALYTAPPAAVQSAQDLRNALTELSTAQQNLIDANAEITALNLSASAQCAGNGEKIHYKDNVHDNGETWRVAARQVRQRISDGGLTEFSQSDSERDAALSSVQLDALALAAETMEALRIGNCGPTLRTIIAMAEQQGEKGSDHG